MKKSQCASTESCTNCFDMVSPEVRLLTWQTVMRPAKQNGLSPRLDGSVETNAIRLRVSISHKHQLTTKYWFQAWRHFIKAAETPLQYNSHNACKLVLKQGALSRTLFQNVSSYGRMNVSIEDSEIASCLHSYTDSFLGIGRFKCAKKIYHVQSFLRKKKLAHLSSVSHSGS